MNAPETVRLSLGPVMYNWPRSRLLAFYAEMAETPLDIVYLGEAVCSKRRQLNLPDWVALGKELRDSGKEVVLSTLALMEAGSELSQTRSIIDNGEFLIEANDMAAVYMLEKAGLPFVGGASLNIYNERTLHTLTASGLVRWVLPVELSQQTYFDIRAGAPDDVMGEVFAFGRLPLAYSARCFTARAQDLPKDDCGLCCDKDPDGRLVSTRDEQEFLVLNGIQTQSALTFNLLNKEPDAGLDVLRISPQSEHTGFIVDLYDRWRKHSLDAAAVHAQAKTKMPTGPCDGYWHALEGMKSSTAPPS